jgi:hypothetical protein
VKVVLLKLHGSFMASGEVAKTNAQCAKRNPGAFGCSDYHRDESPSRRKRSRRQSRTRCGRLHCQTLWSEGTTGARPSRIAAAGNGTGRTNLRFQARRAQIRRVAAWTSRTKTSGSQRCSSVVEQGHARASHPRVHEDIFDRSIDVQILRQRRKLEIDPSAPCAIQAERCFGDVFVLPVEPF